MLQILGRKQIKSIVESESRINIWHGSIRSGKTIASIIAFLMAVATAPSNGLIVIVGRTLDTIGRNIMEPLTEHTLFGPVKDSISWTPGAKNAVIFGRIVHLVGANDRLAEGKIRGATVSLSYVDEASLIPRDFFRQLLGRMSVKGARMFATTNPDNPAHWLKKEFINRQDELNLSHWKFGLDDNPSLDPEYVSDLKSEYVGLWYKRFILGDWVQSEGAVYEMWDDSVHVVKRLPQIIKWVGVGIDYGTTNPFAALSLGLGADRRLYLANEWRWDSTLQKRQLTDVEYSKRVRDWAAAHPLPDTKLKGIRPDWWVIDPSAASFRIQMYEDGIAARLADNDVMSGIRSFSSLLTTDRLKVHESCKGLIQEMPGYSWDSTKAEGGSDAPIKVDDHSLDAGRYVVNTTRAVWSTSLREPVLAA
jgi:PBSX family phage terminase large subunit